jgi:Tfp pilus assembly protein PilV
MHMVLVSIKLTLLKGEHYSAQYQSRPKKSDIHTLFFPNEGQTCTWFNVCRYQSLSQYSEAVPVKELGHDDKFCTHKYIVSKLVNDCLTFSIEYCDECHLQISVNHD